MADGNEAIVRPAGAPPVEIPSSVESGTATAGQQPGQTETTVVPPRRIEHR
jgi:hypothetical protein